MYDHTQIKAAFITKLGWRQNPDPDGPQLTEMIAPTAGLYYNGVHPMLTMENIISVATRFDQIHAGDNAARDAAFTAWVKERTEEYILKAISDWINLKFENRTARNLLDRSRLFDGTGNMNNIEISTGDVVGLEIVPARSLGTVAKIRRFSIQLEENQPVTVRLFSYNKKTHLYTVDVNYTGAGAPQWTDVTDWVLPGEGAYWLAYDQAEISGNAINGVQDFHYGVSGIDTFPSGRYFGARAFKMANEADLTALWDISRHSYTVGTNFGLNVDMSVKCDYTDFIIDQADMFLDLILLRVGMYFLKEIAFNANARENRNLNTTSQETILAQVEGDIQVSEKYSLRKDYQATLNAIQFDTTGIDKICLPCKRRSVKYTSIGPMKHY